MEVESSNVCRVCLSCSETKCVSIFDKYREYFIFDYINLIADVKIKENDGLPNKICPVCLLDLETAINFKQKCENSNATLLNSSVIELIKIDNEVAIVKKEEPEEGTDYFVDDNHIDDDTELSESCNDKQNWKGMTARQKKVMYNKNRPSRAIDEKLQCHDCGGSFKSKCKLRVHWKKVHLPQALICQNCKRTFQSFKAYNNHVKSNQKACKAASNVHVEGEGKARVFYCKHCDFKSGHIKTVETHMVKHTGERPFACDMCPKKFTQLSALNRHKEMGHKLYLSEAACQFCGKLIKGRFRMYQHLKNHTSKVQCDICQKWLTNKSSLQVHKLRHAGVKTFMCDECPLKFYSPSELYIHRHGVHIRDKLFQCSICEYKSPRMESIRRHEIRHRNDNISCTVCGKFFDTIEKHEKHQKVHFNKKEFSCPKCDKMFLSQSTVRKHLWKKHRDTIRNNKSNVLVKKETTVGSVVSDNDSN